MFTRGVSHGIDILSSEMLVRRLTLEEGRHVAPPKKRSAHRTDGRFFRMAVKPPRIYCESLVVSVEVLSPFTGSGFASLTVATLVTLVTFFGTETLTTSLITKPVSPGRNGFTDGVVQLTEVTAAPV